MDARLEDLRRHIAKAKIIKETLESSLFLLSHHTAALTRLYAALPHATPAVASHSNDLEPLHALVREMDSDSRDAGGLLAAAAARAGGVVPFKTDSHTRELADVMLAYRQRMADAVGGGMVGSGMVGGDVERFLKGMKAAGVASVEEMQVAREVAGVPEALAEVGWGSYTGPEDDTTLVTQMIVD
ncbi:hypothetical protein BC830DRAFT_805485 [Chytriomyces sp. MP71]|nr:hypothetical protein BC830DRAFT_805485 [Chytriomyces sp. MP71]